MAKKYTICLDIGGTKILGAIFDSEDKIVYRLKKKTKSMGDSASNIEEVIIGIVSEMLHESSIDIKDVNAISAGAPGVINQETGVVLFSPNLPWRNYNIRKPIEEKFGTKFYIGNDVNVGVLGELEYGCAKGFDNVVGLFVGTGMGGGLILEGKLYTGNGFKGAELGHMVLDPKGPPCGCGQRGCLEAFSAKKGMARYILEEARKGRVSPMTDKITDGIFKSKHLKKNLLAGDEVTLEAVDRACHYLAIASGSLINIFSPDMIVYGGGVIEAVGDIFLTKIESEVSKYAMPSILETVEFRKALLGDDSILYGALSLVKNDN